MGCERMCQPICKIFSCGVDEASKTDVYCEAQLMSAQHATKSARRLRRVASKQKKFARREKPVLQCKALLIAAGFKEEAASAADSGDL